MTGSTAGAATTASSGRGRGERLRGRLVRDRRLRGLPGLTLQDDDREEHRQAAVPQRRQRQHRRRPGPSSGGRSGRPRRRRRPRPAGGRGAGSGPRPTCRRVRRCAVRTSRPIRAHAQGIIDARDGDHRRGRPERDPQAPPLPPDREPEQPDAGRDLGQQDERPGGRPAEADDDRDRRAAARCCRRPARRSRAATPIGEQARSGQEADGDQQHGRPHPEEERATAGAVSGAISLEEGRRIDVRDRRASSRTGRTGRRGWRPSSRTPPGPSARLRPSGWARSTIASQTPPATSTPPSGSVATAAREPRRPRRAAALDRARRATARSSVARRSAVSSSSVIPPGRSDGDRRRCALCRVDRVSPPGAVRPIRLSPRLYPYGDRRAARRVPRGGYDGAVPNIALPRRSRGRAAAGARGVGDPIVADRGRGARHHRGGRASAGSTSSRRGPPIATGSRPTSTSTRSTTRTSTRATTARSWTSTTTTSSSSCTSRCTRRRPAGS